MRFVTLYKAQATIAAEPVESVTIELHGEWIGGGAAESYEALAERFQAEAVTLADVLSKTLPGGTLDRLFAELCRRRASLFVVPREP